MPVAWAFFVDPTKQNDCDGCPENPVLLGGHEGIADVIGAVAGLIGIVAIAAAVVILYRHWRRSSAARAAAR